MSRRFFTSDLHVYDEHVLRRRRATNVHEHAAWLGRRWDSVVTSADEVVLLGDIIGEDADPLMFEQWLRARPGHKRLIMGNWEEAVDHEPTYWLRRGYEDADYSGMTTLTNGMTAVMTHRPTLKRSSSNEVILHGHTHRPQKITLPGVIHVGWDAWRMLITESSLIACIEDSFERAEG